MAGDALSLCDWFLLTEDIQDYSLLSLIILLAYTWADRGSWKMN